jgi:hypothetical protein
MFGPDGSGKTSIARCFSGTHEIVAIRGTHTLASLIARFLGHFTLFQGDDNPYFDIKIPERMSGLWCFLEFISVLPIIIHRFILLPKFKSVIAERSIPDFIAWIIATSKIQADIFMRSLLGAFLLRLSSKQNQLIYVKASLEVLHARRPESIELISKQIPVYDTMAAILKAGIIDTTYKTTEESVKEFSRLPVSPKGSKRLIGGTR